MKNSENVERLDLHARKGQHVLEFMLIIVSLGIAVLFTQMGVYRTVALHLFYLPIILAGFFLGRTRAGVLALFAALVVTIAAIAVPQEGSTVLSGTLLVGLTLVTWSSIIGLSAILVGTLCDEQKATLHELKRAYVGVAEVLSKYLQGNDATEKSRTNRVAELCQRVSRELKLSDREMDDIRVAALLHDLGNVEITTQVISRAIGSIDSRDRADQRHTFMGTDLVYSIGNVLEGALPLLVNQDEDVYAFLSESQDRKATEIPLGAHIIRAARAYDQLTMDALGQQIMSSAEAIRTLRLESDGMYEHVIDALEAVVTGGSRFATASEPSANNTNTRRAAMTPAKSK
ncbi:MAG: HD-GYP domain-containing protein [Phycisphaerae bacterium]